MSNISGLDKESQEIASVVRRRRVLLGISSRQEFAQKKNIPQGVIDALEKGGLHCHDLGDALRAIEALHLVPECEERLKALVRHRCHCHPTQNNMN